MSWLFSQALVAEYLGENFSDGEQSAPLNGNPIQQAYCAPDKMTAFSRPSRFGMTFKPLTADRGEELLTLYLAAFHAKTSVWPEKEQESTEPAAACGDTWRGSLARFDPVTSSWKTAQRSLLGDSDESSVIWPRSGMTANGQCWELPTLGRRTSGTGSGLWLTPRATDVGKGERQETFLKRMGDRTDRCAQSLAAQVNNPKTWPTPTVCGNYNRQGASATSGDGLATAVTNWPTPTANCSTGAGHQGRAGGLNLQTAVAAVALKCATQTARDWRSGKASQATMERNSRPLSEQIGGSLNPTWVEWLMGWPLGWTDLKPLEMDKSPYAPQPLGDC
jgi:hypothetical protein